MFRYQNRAVDNEATRLINTIQKFLIRFKEEKEKGSSKETGSKTSIIFTQDQSC